MSWTGNVAVLGAGKLGSALIRGLLDSGTVNRSALHATAETELTARQLSERFSIQATAGGNAAAALQSDVVVLAVKPARVGAVLEEIRGALRPGQILISMAAAVPLRVIEKCAPPEMALFRAMPNLAMTVLESATTLCHNDAAGAEQRELVERMFRTVGSAAFLPEDMFDAVTALAGSGPAYVCTVIEALTAGGVKMGIPQHAARDLATKTLLGAARLLLERDIHPAALRDEVTTPGGTTIAGLHELERGAVFADLMSAVEAATIRSAELRTAIEERLAD